MAHFPDEACSPVEVESRGEACFAPWAWSPCEVHSAVEPQLVDEVPQEGLLELHFAAFPGEERCSPVDCFLVEPLDCWPVVGRQRVRQEGCKAPLHGWLLQLRFRKMLPAWELRQPQVGRG